MYKKPIAVASIQNGIAKGSVRSIEGVNFGDILQCAKQNLIIQDGGGHAMAGGFTVKESNLKKLNTYIEDAILNINNIEHFIANAMLLEIDAPLLAQGVINY